jgi:hypothetical protein
MLLLNKIIKMEDNFGIMLAVYYQGQCFFSVLDVVSVMSSSKGYRNLIINCKKYWEYYIKLLNNNYISKEYNEICKDARLTSFYFKYILLYYETNKDFITDSELGSSYISYRVKAEAWKQYDKWWNKGAAAEYKLCRNGTIYIRVGQADVDVEVDQNNQHVDLVSKEEVVVDQNHKHVDDKNVYAKLSDR